MTGSHNVTIYSTSTCPYCQQAKKYLGDKGVAYVDKDVGADLQARDEMVKRTGQLGVPVIDVDGKVVVGFNRAKLDELLSA